MADTLIRLPEVSKRTGLKRASVYREIRAGRFPAPIRLTERTSAWAESRVNQWIDEKIRTSEAG